MATYGGQIVVSVSRQLETEFGGEKVVLPPCSIICLKAHNLSSLALDREMMKNWPPGIRAALNAGRLLIITRYADSVTHAPNPAQRNRLMMELTDEIVIGYTSPGGNLERLCGENHGEKASRRFKDDI